MYFAQASLNRSGSQRCLEHELGRGHPVHHRSGCSILCKEENRFALHKEASKDYHLQS